MTKADIVEKVAQEIKISKAAAARAFAVITGSITDTLKKGDKLTIVGFGTFSVASRSAPSSVVDPQLEVCVCSIIIAHREVPAGIQG